MMTENDKKQPKVCVCLCVCVCVFMFSILNTVYSTYIGTTRNSKSTVELTGGNDEDNQPKQCEMCRLGPR